MHPTSFVVLSLAVANLSVAADPTSWRAASPDGNLILVASAGPKPAIHIEHRGITVVPPSPWGITTRKGGAFPGSLRMVKATTVAIDESYAMPVGKRSHCHNHGNQTTLDFADDAGVRFSLVLRAHDEGVAYRYRIHGSGEDAVMSETSAFRIPPGAQAWYAAYSRCYESIYRRHDGVVDATGEIQFPVLMHMPTSRWVMLTEAAVDGTYAGARISTDQAAQGLLGLKLDGIPTATLPWTTPWRVLFVVEELRTLVESTLVNDLNPQTSIADTSWIKPGTAIFPWLTGSENGGGPCRRNNNGSLERMREFVDLARDMGWPWIEFDNALALDTPFGGPPEKWMDCPWFPQLTAYATSQGVSAYGWDHVCNLDTPEKRRIQLDWYVANGFKGIKVDFLDSDTQARYRLREDLARDCAARRLLISYHGDITPRGMQRTWPNIATHEGVMGEEFYLFGKQAPTPTYNVNLVFTRNIPGSMDYTPTTFDNPGKHAPRLTTSAHEIALAVVFESGWQSMGFNPESVRNHAPARAFLKDLPSTWDDIRLVAGEPDGFAVVARRKGRDWWLAGINAGIARTVSLDLGFLAPGDHAGICYHDDAATRGSTPLDTRVATTPTTLNSKQPWRVNLPANGGFGIRIVDGATE